MRVFLLIIVVLYSVPSRAQSDIRDSSLLITSVRASYAAQIPAGLLSERFGWNSNLGIHSDVKFKNNFLVGVEGNFLFGNKVVEDPIAHLRTESGDIIAQDGTFATVLLYERGFAANVYGGYVWRVLNPNPNSGILFKVGVGFLQHKIRIEHNQDKVVALEGDYLKGYDRLTNGINVNQFIGYQYLSNSRLLNFFGGFEFYQGFTKSRRSWDTDLLKQDTKNRVDQLMGFRLGWMVLLYKRAPKQFYYN